ncbi:MAG TPA: hypothetical protein VMU55_05685 [Solirubrobacteraceae bacterium]|nr:hypothetical protein [Solirubrobacteraceae bacterium]
MSSRRSALACIAAPLAVALTACGASAHGTSATTARSPTRAGSHTAAAAPHAPAVAVTPCGPAAAEVLARTAGSVAQLIYAGESTGSETLSDKRQIESYRPLLSALERGEKAAVKAAVTTLVFSHTHVVRLRVSRGSQLLADVGGPYILAPVSGTLRSHGRPVGQYSFSVQDDLGYVKLVTRFIGVPLVLRTASGQVPVEGLLSPGPASIPNHGPVVYRHSTYEAFSFNASAYPSGRLRVSLLLEVPPSLSAKSCSAIKTTELSLIAQRISRRFALSPASFSPYIKLVRTLTSGLVYIRSGSRTLAGSTHPGPARLPSSGALRYHGRNYGVSSFAARASVGQVRVYLLVRL